MVYGRLICLFILFQSFTAFAQTEIKGILIDSAHRTFLESATISVYEKGDSKVSKVALSDRFGKFILKDLPANKALRAEFTYQGFEKVVIEFKLQTRDRKDLGVINMLMQADELNAVEILAPVRLNGDTIEFNADAFALDTNAVIEDLLHKLPGMVVWGDGMITYNGREIPNVLVNGKPFFGSDKGIALQNIDKEAVKKLQVYDTRPEEKKLEDPLNPNYEMNVVLKEGRERMYFGNLTAAGGTQERYEGNVNLNVANRKTQSTVAYSANNTNKYLNSVDQLLKNTTFKGVGVNADFDSDFLRTGILRQQVLGGRLQYDFKGTGEVNEVNLLTGDILTRWDRTLVRDSSLTQLVSEDGFGANRRSNVSGSEQAFQSQQGHVGYQVNKRRNHRDWSLNASLQLNHEDRQTEYKIDRMFDYAVNQSRLESFQDGHLSNKGMRFSTTLFIGENTGSEANDNFGQWLKYKFELSSNLHQNRSGSRNQTDFQDLLNKDVSRYIHRQYNSVQDGGNHSLAATVEYKSLEFINRLQLSSAVTDARAGDIQNGIYRDNETLTHVSDYNQLIYNSLMRYRLRLYDRNLTGRVSERLSAEGGLGYRLQHERNASTLAYRNVRRQYASPIPEAALKYHYSRAGLFIADARLTYALEETYPTLQQLRPLYDDIDPTYRYFGGANLRETRVQVLSAIFDFREMKAYGIAWKLEASYRNSVNGLSDSIHYSDGQQQVYLVNISRPMQSYRIESHLSKAFLLEGDRNLNLILGINRGWNDRFQFVDGQEQNVEINFGGASLDVFYARLNKMQLAWSSQWNRYERFNPAFSASRSESTEWASGLSASYQLVSRWNIASNLTIRHSSSFFHQNKALVWNGSSTYRLLKGNNLHIKLSAYDLLRQFKGVYQSNLITEFTSGYRNNLQQYFTLSLSYFPRKFGL